ncbi:MAG: ribonuclease D [Phycisphaerales bacterium]
MREAASDGPAAPIIDHPLVPSGKPILVEDAEGMAAAADAIRASGTFAYDTEFIGEETYIPQLCVVQLATSEAVWLVDPLAGVDLTPVWELIADPDVTCVVHAGQQDLEPVVRLLDREPAAVVDTQIATGFLDLPYPLSLAALIEHFLGVKIGKGMTFTRWDKRPLSSAHLRYAANDVRYLVAVWRAIMVRLEAAGHLDAVREECTAVCGREHFSFDVDRRTDRVVGSRNFRPRQVAVTRALLTMRDELARERDLPPRSILRDEIVARIAKDMPAQRSDFDRMKGMPRPMIESHGDVMLDLVAAIKDQPTSELPPRVSDEESVADRVAIDSLWAVLQTMCRGRGVDPSLVGGRKDIARLWVSLHHPDRARPHSLAGGWREAMFGAPLRGMIAGEGGFSVDWVGGVVRTATPDA